MREYLVKFTDAATGEHRSARIQAEGYGEPIAKAVKELGGDVNNIYSIWEV